MIDRFCTALYDLAQAKGALESIAQELQQWDKAANDIPELRHVMIHPLLHRAEREKAIVSILQKSGASELMVKFAGTLARKNRLYLLPKIAIRFSEILAEKRGEVKAEVISARPLDAAQMASVQAQLAKIFAGQKIALAAKIDQSILAGVIVRVGSKMIDGSLKTKLNNMAAALKGAA